jgi:hypothetical protein
MSEGKWTFERCTMAARGASEVVCTRSRLTTDLSTAAAPRWCGVTLSQILCSPVRSPAVGLSHHLNIPRARVEKPPLSLTTTGV